MSLSYLFSIFPRLLIFPFPVRITLLLFDFPLFLPMRLRCCAGDQLVCVYFLKHRPAHILLFSGAVPGV